MAPEGGGVSREDRTMSLQVRHTEGERFEVAVRGHTLVVDQPDAGDEGPTPVELFVAGLASCVATLARSYLLRHGLPVDGLTVTAEHDVQERPSRVSDVRLVIALPNGVPEQRRRALLAVASHCTVHNSLRTPPSVTLTATAAEE
jgi:putative redox protein